MSAVSAATAGAGLEHYLDVLGTQAGSAGGIAAVAAVARNGRWPESFDRLWQSLEGREGKQAGTRTMIELLQQGSKQGWEIAEASGRASVGYLGCTDAAAVRHLLVFGELAHAPVEGFELWADWNATSVRCRQMTSTTLLLTKCAEVVR
jgi:hypothetical protein